MSLLNSFLQNIAGICCVNVCDIQCDFENGCRKIIVGQSELLLDGVFFNPPDSSTSASTLLTDYLNAYRSDSDITGKLSPTNTSDRTLYVRALNRINPDIDAGFYECQDRESEKIVIFTGAFTGVSGEPDLTDYPEVLLAMAVLAPRCTVSNNINWVSILEAMGPFMINFSEDSHSITVCDCGLLDIHQQNSFSFDWDNTIPDLVRNAKLGTPEDAVLAYLCALRESTTTDVAFQKLYRVLEILFAGSFKDAIATAPLSKVIALIQSLTSKSELDTLKKLIDSSSTVFSRFTREDFDSLFDRHRPQQQYYSNVTKWLNNTANQFPPNALRAHIIYYVRCALVHSKMNEKEPFLMGPFSPVQEDALKRLVEDTRDVIRDLLFC